MALRVAAPIIGWRGRKTANTGHEGERSVRRFSP